jgi:hypothetical protein
MLIVENRGATGSGLELVTDPCEHYNKPSDSIKGGDILNRLNDCQLLKNASFLWR